MDNCINNKPERRSPLIDWLMGVEQNSVYLSIILVVGCAGLSDCEELGEIFTGKNCDAKHDISTSPHSRFSMI